MRIEAEVNHLTERIGKMGHFGTFAADSFILGQTPRQIWTL